ncbi:MAG TPA: ATP-binding protein [Streptomyces sp.]
MSAPHGPLLRVMVGGPGCGKTTYCERQLAVGRFGTRLSLDRERAVLGRHEHDQAATPAAVEMVRAIAGALLASGREVTIDATATTAAERGTWLALARRHAAVPVAVIVRAPLAVALARNATRARPVPEPVVREFWHRVYVLTLAGLLAEGFRVVTEVDTAPPTTPEVC